MRWRGNRTSNNIEDRRGTSARVMRGAGASGVLRLLPVVFRVLGFKGTVILGLLIFGFLYFTDNLGLLVGQGVNLESEPARQSQPVRQSAKEKELVEFVSVVLADTEDTWGSLFQQMGTTYSPPKLVLYRQSVNSGCGFGSSQIGPFYCPVDQKVYIDLSFYDDLKNRHGAPGDFAQAYVIAHEIGHHVQNLTGIAGKVRQEQKKLNKTASNKLSVKQELQADCFAGLWAFHANRSRNLLEAGDFEEGLVAASAIGDDRLQKQTHGHVVPDSFTHGSSAQRVDWFKKGFQTGEFDACNTFKNE
jgi:predicted metalloprotease